MNRKKILTFTLMLAVFCVNAQRWHIDPNKARIIWQPSDDIPHENHIEMSGEEMAFVLRWGVDNTGSFRQERSLVFPLLRTLPNDTHASLTYRIASDIPSLLGVDNRTLQGERVEQVIIDGSLEVKSFWSISKSNLGLNSDTTFNPSIEMRRVIFPSCKLPLMCERYVIRNIDWKPLTITVPKYSQIATTDSLHGVEGSYIVQVFLSGDGTFILAPSDSIVFHAVFQGYRYGEQPIYPDVESEYALRMEFIKNNINDNLTLETPDTIINTEFRYAKIRAAESIIKTRNGYMHAPGGEVFYAAIWANDQAEYVNPFFPFLGYEVANESALNSFRHFARFMNPEFQPIPSSIIAEGTDIWDGAGDRGDAAMIAYGATRYALARGIREEAEELWPLIEWCLEYCRRKLTSEGVVASDTDELEGRFPSGDANLCTSTLYYDALLSAVYLENVLGIKTTRERSYSKQAEQLAIAIERYFGAKMGKYSTYRYYKGNTTLRAWISMPLIVGLNKRTKGTVEALTGPELMTHNGLLTEQGDSVFWDRSTLYAMRAIYNAGYTDTATELLHKYSLRRLLGDHVPYPIEAWPEGSQRHLSAESGLYCRIITEGLFGIRPTGFRTFVMTPRLPTDWNNMSLRHIRAFNSNFDIFVERISANRSRVTIKESNNLPQVYEIDSTSSLHVTLVGVE